MRQQFNFQNNQQRSPVQIRSGGQGYNNAMPNSKNTSKSSDVVSHGNNQGRANLRRSQANPSMPNVSTVQITQEEKQSIISLFDSKSSDFKFKILKCYQASGKNIKDFINNVNIDISVSEKNKDPILPKCKDCGKPILGIKFSCTHCINYDLCVACYNINAFSYKHPYFFVAIDPGNKKKFPFERTVETGIIPNNALVKEEEDVKDSSFLKRKNPNQGIEENIINNNKKQARSNINPNFNNSNNNPPKRDNNARPLKKEEKGHYNNLFEKFELSESEIKLIEEENKKIKDLIAKLDSDFNICKKYSKKDIDEAVKKAHNDEFEIMKILLQKEYVCV